MTDAVADFERAAAGALRTIALRLRGQAEEMIQTAVSFEAAADRIASKEEERLGEGLRDLTVERALRQPVTVRAVEGRTPPEMEEWLAEFPREVVESPYFAEEINRAADEGLVRSDLTRHVIYQRIAARAQAARDAGEPEPALAKARRALRSDG